MTELLPPPPTTIIKPPKVLFDVQCLAVVQVVGFVCGCVMLVLAALIVARVDRLAEDIGTLDASAKDALAFLTSGASSASDGDDAAAYSCPTPSSDAYAALGTHDTWIVMGGNFAAGEGVSSDWASNSYLQLLRAHVKQQSGAPADIALILAAGRFAGNLTEQAEWLHQQDAYQSLVALKHGAVVIVATSLDYLLSSDDATLDEAERQLNALFVGDAAVVPFTHRDAFPLVLVAQPDPSAGGMSVDRARAECVAGLAPLNAPTLAQRARLDGAFAAVRTLYAQLARRYGGAMLVDVDAALAQFSLASAPTMDDTIFNTDCSTLNNRGHLALADVLAQCWAGKPYVAPSAA